MPDIVATSEITSTLGERLKYALIPGPLYIRYRVRKEIRHGEPELALLPLLIDPQRNAIDAGANKGVYTHVISRLARHTYAYEPNPKMFALLRRTVDRRASVFPLALSDHTGRAELRIPYGSRGHSNQGASLSAAKVSGRYTAVSVEAARIDDLGLTDIGFIKIDVEGHEREVLDGARQLIMRDRPNLLIEIEERHTKRRIEDELQAVLGLGYDGFFVAEGALTPLDRFDPVAHHRNPTGRYVFNFVFRPAGRTNGG